VHRRTERRAKHGRLAEENQNKLSRVRGGAIGWSVMVAVFRVRSVIEGAAEAEPQASNSLEFDDELPVLDHVSTRHAISTNNIARGMVRGSQIRFQST
jgi:hypothetical protein